MTAKEAPTSQPAGMRASDTERERTVEALRTHYETGHIGYAEFNERMESAYQATHSAQLTALLADLPGAYRQQPSVPAVATPPARKERPGAGKIVAITGLVLAALVGLSWITGFVTSHPVISLLAAGAIVFVVVKRPFRNRG